MKPERNLKGVLSRVPNYLHYIRSPFRKVLQEYHTFLKTNIDPCNSLVV